MLLALTVLWHKYCPFLFLAVLSLPVVYAIAAVGTVLTLAILILSVFVCVACSRAKREKALLAEVRHVTPYTVIQNLNTSPNVHYTLTLH